MKRKNNRLAISLTFRSTRHGHWQHHIIKVLFLCQHHRWALVCYCVIEREMENVTCVSQVSRRGFPHRSNTNNP